MTCRQPIGSSEAEVGLVRDQDPNPTSVVEALRFGTGAAMAVDPTGQAANLIEALSARVQELEGERDSLEEGWGISRVEWAALVQDGINALQAAEARIDELTGALVEFSTEYDGFMNGDGEPCPTLIRARAAIAKAALSDGGRG